MSEGNAIDPLFRAMFDAKASDLHLCVGSPPIIRKDGHMQPLDPAAAPLTAQELIGLIGPIMPEKNRKEFTEKHDTDFSYAKSVSCFSVNSFRFFSGMMGPMSPISSCAVNGAAAGSSGCIWPSLRMIGGDPTHRCRSDAFASNIARNSGSMALPSLMTPVPRSRRRCARC